ncbi:MAG: monodechloroaminopyrrolnitrin synthase PrnB family protein [Actinophytocola sp.]|uniref:monodechloroaminopyrrolnitrin synthase PrnB family protein n=1 Tax=Actinophytocola sp. TaxID=1872138 RepID=UPI003D6A41C0
MTLPQGFVEESDKLDPRLVINANPLDADVICGRLPEINAAGDLRALVVALRRLLPDERVVANYRFDECLAAMRDLGMLIGSVKRHGIEPCSVVPEAVPVLQALGRRTSMVPRDTVHHYTQWNPLGQRCRMYVGDPQERILQDSVRLVFPHMVAALDLCADLSGIEPWDPEFPVLLAELTERVGTMIEAMDMVTSGVTPEFFARVLRPYFEEVTVGDEILLGPAAAQVPLWLVDLAVWASDRSEPEYAKFLAESVPYSLPRWRDYYDSWLLPPSLVTRLVHALEHTPEVPDARAVVDDSARRMAELLRTVVIFRGRHHTMARKTYHIELRLYERGSGGADVNLLTQILGLTRQAAAVVRPGARTH